MKTPWILLQLFISGITCALPYQSPQQAAHDTEQLVKATQNPVADLISVPFQNNLNYPIGTFNRYQDVLNVQPVIPVAVGPWNLITRTILPVINQPNVGSPNGSRAGLGDLISASFCHRRIPGGSFGASDLRS
jgi:hypothetical protein